MHNTELLNRPYIPWDELTREAQERLRLLLTSPESYTAQRTPPAASELQEDSFGDRLTLLSDALGKMPMAVVLADSSWRIIEWLARAPSNFGLDAHTIIGADLRPLFLPTIARYWDTWSAHQDAPDLAHHIATELETSCVRPDGTELPVLLAVQRVNAAANSPPGWLVLIHDIRARRKLEEELRQAQKLEALGMLTGGITHDLNNLLTVILGHLELAELEISRPKLARRDLDGIRAAVERAAALTVKLLAFARAQFVEPQLLDVVEIVSQLHPILERTLSENIRMRLDLHADAHFVRVDLVQMEQLLINLVVNARDAIGERTGQVLITTKPRVITSHRIAAGGVELPPGDYIVLSVIDDGDGIIPADQERIFDPFFTTKPEGRGTGLGLSTCLRIARQNDGYIRCESRPGLGTIFELWLPRHRPPEHPDALSISTELYLPRRGTQVLVVEDDRALRSTIARTLEHHGYTVYEARQGRDAIELLARRLRQPDLIISDVVMPDMGGSAMAEALLLRDIPCPPILFISGYADDVLAAHQVSSHANFLPKPFTPKRLLLRVQELLMRADTRHA